MIALIAGTGALPGVLVQALVAQGDAPVVCAMAGFAPDIPADLQFRIETLGSLLNTLRGKGVTRICMAGAVRRPVINPAAIDALTLPLIPHLTAAMAKGDDGTLRGIIALIEAQGFDVVGAEQIAPHLLPPVGEIALMGRSDTGQACVVAAGMVLDREDSMGTDALLARVRVAPRMADGAVLVKAPKPGQDRRVDLPVIGPETARGAAGLAGLVIQAGGVMVIDLPQVVSVLDRQGMFLWVRP
jgi:UDP-2,3-diacylglucosamine hydrolase